MRQIRRFLFSFLIILIFSILNCGAGIIVDILKNQILFLPYLGFYTKPTDYYLTQQLDHFELTNDTTWKQVIYLFYFIFFLTLFNNEIYNLLNELE